MNKPIIQKDHKHSFHLFYPNANDLDEHAFNKT